MSASLKKCPSCTEWVQWRRDIHECCPNCGDPLSPRELVEFQRKSEESEDAHSMRLRLISIGDDDPFLLVILKRIVQGGQLLFFGIASFLVWLATIIVG